MKSVLVAGLLAALTGQVVGHATFQQLWVGSTDHGSTCVRTPNSNSPVTNVNSQDIICNANRGAVSGKCPVAAGGTVTIEMHQQPGDRNCGTEGIGGNHWGPVLVYMARVSNSASGAPPSSGWFKIYQNTWAKRSGSGSGADDYWGVKDLNANCGRLDVRIPTNIAAGDYLLRAEVIALHSASGSGGAQFYMSCYQLTVSGGSGGSPATVSFPGAYRASDPGIQINIYQTMSSYTAPGPAVISGGQNVQAGTGGSNNG